MVETCENLPLWWQRDQHNSPVSQWSFTYILTHIFLIPNHAWTLCVNGISQSQFQPFIDKMQRSTVAVGATLQPPDCHTLQKDMKLGGGISFASRLGGNLISQPPLASGDDVCILTSSHSEFIELSFSTISYAVVCGGSFLFLPLVFFYVFLCYEEKEEVYL